MTSEKDTIEPQIVERLDEFFAEPLETFRMVGQVIKDNADPDNAPFTNWEPESVRALAATINSAADEVESLVSVMEQALKLKREEADELRKKTADLELEYPNVRYPGMYRKAEV